MSGETAEMTGQEGGGASNSSHLSSDCVVCGKIIEGQDYIDRHELVEGDTHSACCPCWDWIKVREDGDA